ncbi:MAG: glutaredoxin [Lachnospiraceae bacterium]|nr:glutaredoxin [Lachnospiraceae bacterium]
MEKIRVFYLDNCPYCKNAMRAFFELKNTDDKYHDIDIDWVNETSSPQIADQYDYWYCPSMFLGKEKLYEAQPGETYEQCHANVVRVLDQYLEQTKGA